MKALSRNHRGFTLIEVMATLLLMAIVLPVIMRGVYVSTGAADTARRRTEAAGLAEQKLNEIIATNLWQTPTLNGDFGNDWPDYRWSALAQPWAGDTTIVGLQQIDVTVTWKYRNKDQSITVSSLTYTRGQSQ